MEGQWLIPEVIDELLCRCGVHHGILFTLHHQHRHRFRPSRRQSPALRQKRQILLQPLAPQGRQTLQ